jgi:hypothetical protein
VERSLILDRPDRQDRGGNMSRDTMALRGLVSGLAKIGTPITVELIEWLALVVRFWNECQPENDAPRVAE